MKYHLFIFVVVLVLYVNVGRVAITEYRLFKVLFFVFITLNAITLWRYTNMLIIIIIIIIITTILIVLVSHLTQII